ncbi:VCBS repeat-containing protein [Bradyrhizobium sp. USDA 4504]
MATTQNTSGGTTTSFSNTPQAVDDSYNYSASVSGILILNVMANDLGGAAKSLWSVDNDLSVSVTSSNGKYAPADLLTKDTVYSTTLAGDAGTSDRSLLGAKIWINSDGTIGYDASSISAQLQAKAAGETLVDKFTYAIRLGNGTLSWATTTLTFTGVNDGPVLSADASGPHNITELAGHTGDTIDHDTTTGTLAFTDADLSDTHVVSKSDPNFAWSGGPLTAAQVSALTTASSLTVTETDSTGSGSGSVSFSYSAIDQTFDFLAQGETLTVTYNLTVTDNHGASSTKPITITITGTNDAPVVTAALTSTAAEGAASYPLNLLSGASDPDHGETATLSVADVSYAVDGGASSSTAPAGVSLSGSTLTVDPTDPAFNSLAVGEHMTIVVSYNVKDAQGATVAQTETITITGTNDAPVVAAALTSTAAEGAASYPLNLLSGASDPDHGETATLSVADVSYAVDGGASSSTAPAGVSLSGSTLTVDPTDPAFNSLAVGEHMTIVVSYNVKDAQGATVAQTETITITGTNDAPVVAAALTSTAAEGAASYPLNLLSGASDPDHGETATLSVADVSYAVDGGASSSTAPAGVSLSGSTLTVDPTDPAFNSLAVGEHMTIVVSYNVKDAQGATVAQTETITITGTNDAPVVAAALTSTAAEGAASYPLNLLSGASDPDHGETATLSVADVSYAVDGGASSSTAPAGVSLSGSTLTVDPTDPAFNSLAVGEHMTIVVSYNVKDAQGATVAQTETITITGTNDAPVVAAALTSTAAEGAASYPLNLLSGASDPDHGETATLSVADVSYAVDGGASSSTAPAGVSLSGSMLTVDPTDPAFNSLAVGEHMTIVVSYNVKDAQGATVAQTETITITGTNDAPVVAAALTSTAAEGAASYPLNLLSGASDPDHGETATLSVADVSYAVDGGASSSTAPAGVSLSGSTLTVDPTDPAFNSLAVGEHMTIVVSYNVKDAQGATVAQTETITITGTNDAPVVAAALTSTAAEGAASYPLNLLSGASDPDHGETATLSVADVSYAVDGGASSSTAPAGVSLSGSTLTVDPTDPAFNSLAVGEHMTIVVSYNVKDAQGATVAQTETITITGTNDAPVVAAALTSTAAEGAASYPLNLLSGASDPDHGETATLSVADVSYAVDGGASSSTAPAGVSLSGSTLTVDPTDPAFNSLAVGEHMTIVVSYNVKDAQGATVAQTETITITGTNDAPVVAAALTSTAAEGAASYPLNLLSGASDPDHGETATLSVADVSYAVDGGASSSTAPAGVSLSGSTLTVDPTDPAFNSLAVGEHMTIVVSYNVKDAQGATVAQTETITITGTNDAPVVAAALTSTAAEGAASYPLNLLSGASDPDHGETATLSVADVSYAVDGGASSSTAPAGVSLSGSTLTVDPTDPAFNSLAVGEHMTIVVSYNVKDAQGATVAQTETITITGTNDAPVVAAALTSTAAEGAASYPLNLLSGASDPDHGETATLSVADVSYAVDGGASSSTAPAGVSLSGSTLTVDPTDPAFNSLAVGEHMTIVVSYNVKDAQGATVAQTETITITGTNDAPVVAAALTSTAAEGAASYPLNLLSGASDPDHGETATLSVADVSYAVDGGASSSTAPAGVSLSGSMLTVDPTDPAFNSLAVGEHMTIVVSYNVKDAQGATVAQTETITITGTNDAPVVAAALTSTAAEGAASYPLNLLSGASDPDHGETATLSVADVSYAVDGGASSSTAPAGVSLSGSTLTVDPTDPAFNSLAVGEHMTIVVSYNVKDAQGATVAQTETITITGTNDAPVANADTGTVNEDATLTMPAANGVIQGTTGGSVADTDVDNATSTLVVSGVVAGTGSVTQGVGVATSIAGTYGHLTLNANGSYSYVADTANSLATGVTAVDTFTYTAKDPGGLVSNSTTLKITVTGTNDAPVLDPSKTPVLTAENQGSGAPAGAVGTLVSSLVDLNPPSGGLDNVTDVDSGAVTGIALTGTDTSHGTWFFSTNNGATWTAVGAVSNTTALLLSADANTRLYFQPSAGFAGTDTNAITFRAWDQTSGSNGVKVDTSSNGGTTAFSTAIDTANITINATDTTPPTVISITGGTSLPAGNSETITFTFSEKVTNLTLGDISLADSSNGTSLSNLQSTDGGLTWTATFTKGSSNSTTISVFNSGTTAATDPYWTDLSGNPGTGGGSLTISKKAPAGISGQPINLGLEQPEANDAAVSVTITSLPTGWTVPNGTKLSDGSFAVTGVDLGALTVTTPLEFVGAAVITISATWANPDGSFDTILVRDNVEAYAPGSPIFAWSGDDHLTGSSGHDTFVFSQPIGNDVVHSFEVSSDVIDLISYGWQSFADVQAHTADDAHGNAVITLADGQTITLDGVHASDLTAANFEFDVTPTVENPGQMTIGDGAMLPLSGVIHNTGEIDLQASGDDTLLQIIQTGITLNGGGHVLLSDDDHNIIAGTASNVTLDNVDNVISGAGQIGQGSLTLSNEGTIDATGTHALVIDTGANVIANAGTLEATGTGGLVLASAVANSGLIWANGGTVTAEGDVTGNGNALISGAGTIEFGAASAAGVTFDTTAAGHLILDDAFHFSGTVTGLDGNDDIDLKGISFGAGTTLSFTENQAGTGGTLTVSDGAHTANIVLLGQYDPNGFAEKADATNGTMITYDPHHVA